MSFFPGATARSRAVVLENGYNRPYEPLAEGDGDRTRVVHDRPMFDWLRRLFGEDREGSRPYERLDPEEIVEQYARGRARLESDGWSGAPPETVMQCRKLMAEWERRGYDPNVLDEAAQRLEDDFDEVDLDLFET